MNIIVAMCKNRGIGFKNTIPWYLPTDLERFKDLTTSQSRVLINNVIMGRKTWDSLPKKVKPLPKRKNIIISSKKNIINNKNVVIHNNIESIKEYNSVNTWIIGGNAIYKYCLDHNLVNNIFLTVIHDEYKCDVFFPELPENFKLHIETPIEIENNIRFNYQQWINVDINNHNKDYPLYPCHNKVVDSSYNQQDYKYQFA